MTFFFTKCSHIVLGFFYVYNRIDSVLFKENVFKYFFYETFLIFVFLVSCFNMQFKNVFGNFYVVEIVIFQ